MPTDIKVGIENNWNVCISKMENIGVPEKYKTGQAKSGKTINVANPINHNLEVIFRKVYAIK